MDNRFPWWAITVPWALIVAVEVFAALAFHQSVKGEAYYNYVLIILILNSILLGLTTIMWGPYVLRSTGLSALPGVDSAAAALRTARGYLPGGAIPGAVQGGLVRGGRLVA